MNCSNCESFVSVQFTRVMGDNDDEVHACPHCSTARDQSDGFADA